MNESFTAEEIASIIQDEGYKALVVTDEDGDVTISSASNGKEWRVVLYGSHPFYESITFKALRYITHDPIEACDKFNAEYRFVKTYRSEFDEQEEGDYYFRIEMDCDFKGGVSKFVVGSAITKWIDISYIAEEFIRGQFVNAIDRTNLID